MTQEGLFMKRFKIAALLLALACVVTLTSCVPLRARDMKTWNFDFTETITALDLTDVSCDIVLKTSKDSGCHVEITDYEKTEHTAKVKNGTLILEADHKFNIVGLPFTTFFNQPRKVTVSLPEGTYVSLNAAVVSGDVSIPDDFGFTGDVRITTVSGDVKIEAESCEGLSVKTVSGDVHVGETRCKTAGFDTTSGDVELDDLEVKGVLEMNSISGDLKLNEVKADGVTVTTVSGNVRLEKLDAESLSVKTTSGDVTGSLAQSMDIDTDTTSGDVNVPSGGGEGHARIHTTSGDIHLTIDKED